MTAPTSDERREVAERLREYGNDTLKDGSLLKTLKDVTGADSWRHVLLALADLIDPTCEMVVKYGHACCGRCGHVLAGEGEVEEGYYEFRPFCPDCGARAVRDDA